MKLKIEQLVVTKENPRTTAASEASHKALVASMSTHGLIQPIVVRLRADESADQTTYEVIAGSRRFKAAKELGWEEVECVENDAEYGVGELGAAENMLREAMHPLDECKVIARLVADGETMTDVAGRFGQTEKWAEQRLALAGLAPEVQKAFREGVIGIGAAQAFTLADKKAQKEYIGQAKGDWMLSAEAIRRHFMNSAIPGHYALFDQALYPQDKIRRDLFGEGVLFEDRKKFDELQRAAIEQLEDTLEGEGWGNVVLMLNGPDYKVSGAFVRTEGRILKADRGKYACLITYSPSTGAVTIEKGVAARKDAKKVTAGKTADEDKTTPEEVAAKTADELSDNQLLILAAHQTKAIELEIASGNWQLALATILGPLLPSSGKGMSWCAGHSEAPDYSGANKLLVDKLEIEDEIGFNYKLPSNETLERMKLKDLGDLLCSAALRSMTLVGTRPTADAAKMLKDNEAPWIVFDEGFLNRYRTDQLEDLADRLDLDREGVTKKADLVKLIREASADLDLDKVIKIELV